MQIARVYKDLDITYGELAQALLSLGFKDISKGDSFHFLHSKSGSEVELHKKEPHEKIWKPHVAAYSYKLFHFGIIKDEFDLAKLIEKNRLAAAKQEAVPA